MPRPPAPVAYTRRHTRRRRPAVSFLRLPSPMSLARRSCLERVEQTYLLICWPRRRSRNCLAPRGQTRARMGTVGHLLATVCAFFGWKNSDRLSHADMQLLADSSGGYQDLLSECARLRDRARRAGVELD